MNRRRLLPLPRPVRRCARGTELICLKNSNFGSCVSSVRTYIALFFILNGTYVEYDNRKDIDFVSQSHYLPRGKSVVRFLSHSLKYERAIFFSKAIH